MERKERKNSIESQEQKLSEEEQVLGPYQLYHARLADKLSGWSGPHQECLIIMALSEGLRAFISRPKGQQSLLKRERLVVSQISYQTDFEKSKQGEKKKRLCVFSLNLKTNTTSCQHTSSLGSIHSDPRVVLHKKGKGGQVIQRTT